MTKMLVAALAAFIFSAATAPAQDLAGAQLSTSSPADGFYDANSHADSVRNALFGSNGETYQTTPTATALSIQ